MTDKRLNVWLLVALLKKKLGSILNPRNLPDEIWRAVSGEDIAQPTMCCLRASLRPNPIHHPLRLLAYPSPRDNSVYHVGGKHGRGPTKLKTP
jgi:hypothetical protein